VKRILLLFITQDSSLNSKKIGLMEDSLFNKNSIWYCQTQEILIFLCDEHEKKFFK